MEDERKIEKILPISWVDWDGDLECFQFEDVIFTDDWGQFKKGDTLECLTFLLSEGKWEAYRYTHSLSEKTENKMDSAMSVVATGEFKLTPV